MYVCVCLSGVTFMSPAKTAQPIEMSFEVLTRVGFRNHYHVLDGAPITQEKGQFLGVVSPTEKYWEVCSGVRQNG